MRALFILICPIILACGCSSGGTTNGACTPVCEDRECGPDGCGGQCGVCSDELECTNDSCVNGKCTAVMQEFFCLLNGACVPSGTVNPNNPCASCQPASNGDGWSPVVDQTTCGPGQICFKGDCCDPAVGCEGKECGSDKCGGMCGECPEEATCKKGICKLPCQGCSPLAIKCLDEFSYASCLEADGCFQWAVDPVICPGEDKCACLFLEQSADICEPEDGRECVCIPNCSNKECGSDGCGGLCGQCNGFNVVCVADQCKCAGPQCGDICCASYEVCTAEIECCEPACNGVECGEDGCGGLCGVCEGGQWVACIDGTCVCSGTMCPKVCCSNTEVCDSDGFCCTEDCSGKECGDNSCGGVCGICEQGAACMDGLCPPPGKDCNDGNAVDWDGCTDFELTEFLVNNTTLEWQINPVVAGLKNGGHVVVWSADGLDGDGAGLFARRFGSDGKAQGEEFQVNTETVDDQESASIAALDGGGFVIVWESWGQDGSAEGVFGQLYGADGVKVTGEFQVPEATLADQSTPVVVGHGDGFVVAWQGNQDGGDWNGIYARMFLPDGSPLGSQFQVNTTTAGDQQEPAIASITGDRLLVTWQSLGQDGDGFGIFGQLLSADGSLYGVEQLLNVFTSDDQQSASLTRAADDGVAAFWQSQGQDNSGWSVIGARFDNELEALGLQSLAGLYTTGDQRDIVSCTLADGTVAAVWASKGQDGSDYGIFARVFSGTMDPLAEEFQVNTFVTSIQSKPDVAALSDGQLIIVWQGWEQAGDGYDIYAARFNADGTMNFH